MKMVILVFFSICTSSHLYSMSRFNSSDRMHIQTLQSFAYSLSLTDFRLQSFAYRLSLTVFRLHSFAFSSKQASRTSLVCNHCARTTFTQNPQVLKFKACGEVFFSGLRPCILSFSIIIVTVAAGFYLKAGPSS